MKAAYGVIATLVTLGVIASDIAMVAWGIYEEEFLSTMIAASWVLVTLGVTVKSWVKCFE